MSEITWTDDEMAEFDRITMALSSMRQMERIEARLDLSRFEKTHGKDKCRFMFEVLKTRTAVM